MTLRFDWQDSGRGRLLNSALSMSVSRARNSNAITGVGNNRMEEFCLPTSTSARHDNLSFTMSQSSSTNNSNNYLEGSLNRVKPTIAPLLYNNNASTITRNSTSALATLPRTGITSNGAANHKVVNVAVANPTSYQTDGVINTPQLPSVVMPLMNAPISPNSSQVASSDDAIGHQEVIEKAATNANRNLSPLLISSRASIANRRLKRRGQSSRQWNVFPKRPARSGIFYSEMQQQPQPSPELIPVEMPQFLNDHVNNIFENTASTGVHSDTMSGNLNDNTLTEHALPNDDSEIDPRNTIQPISITDYTTIIQVSYCLMR